MAGDIGAQGALGGEDCNAERGFGDGSERVRGYAEGDGGWEAGGVDAPLVEVCG